MIMENYFSTLSRWIANLGVVPWLLFLAFLLLPAFAFLLSLLFFVTLVLETISQLLCAQMYCWFNYLRLSWHDLKFNNRKKLHTFKFLVKAPIYLSLIAYASHASPIEQTQSFQRLIETGSKSISLNKGELVQLSLRDIEKYSIGNKEILSAKKLSNENSLLLKANSLGQTYLYLWNKGKKPKKIEIFVHSKRHLLPLKRLSWEINEIGLNASAREKTVTVSGRIETLEQYDSLLQIYRVNKKLLYLEQLDLNPQIRLKKFQELLLLLSQRKLLDLDCESHKLFIVCEASEEVQKSLGDLNEKFFLKFPSEISLSISRQFKISLTLHQFENSQGEAFEFGLQKIEGKLNSLLISDPLALIRDNQISLKENEFKSQTLAKPVLKGRLNTPMKVRIGQEINFLQSVTNGIATQTWRFAGLGIDITLVPHTDRILLKYKTNLSQPGEQGIAINSQQSELLLDLNQEQILFDIGFRVNHKRNQKIPYLSSIPIFGSLFQGKGREKSFKKVLCVVHVQEI